ncbi:hypothetical protein [Gordonia caeni]|uniref:Transmembrane protein n=1 Tax=Gordonia caeni TaxID=1007097 RepID=A0ABP7NP19_9ACTN
MTEQAVAFTPDPATRPKTVRWALRLWLVSGVLLVALGVVSIITTLLGAGWHLDVLGIGVLVIILGLCYLMLSRKACLVPQWRGSLAALSGVSVVMLLVLTIGFQSPGLAGVLAAAVIGLGGTILAYRPTADAWFNGRDCARPDEQ